MKLSHSTMLAVLATSAVVQAAPAPIKAQDSTQIMKRDDLERALAAYEELQALKVKRADLAAELAEREYQVVTDVLTAIKNTELTPVVLKFFVSNETLKNLTITGLEYVIKSGLISLQSLLQLSVESGLVVSVVNDLLFNCQLYVSIFNTIKSLALSLLTGLFKKDGTEKRAYTLEEGIEMLRRDGLMPPDLLEQAGEKRDVDDIIVNLLESLASSGLATQVVETILTDPAFISFGAQVVKQLNSEGLINLSALLSATQSSGLLSQLVKEFLSFDTIKEIAATAVDAFDGKCSSTVSLGNLTIPSTSGSSSSSTSSSGSGLGGLVTGLLGGGSLLSGVTGLLGSLLGGGSGSSSTTTATTAVVGTTATATVAGVSTSTDPCATSLFKRERLRMY
ncbi:CIC11C00000003066 [Sungouiella intermedia]|uniref:CIC11C00000003066 n=1 Tax=Sungouiella intermedia TaxID=45354 RepID=A0A1L0FXM9_9ASCO|nr:CIC11C00000003066 [[Candida] intermedia]